MYLDLYINLAQEIEKKNVCKGPLELLEKGYLYFYSLVLYVSISGYKHNSTRSYLPVLSTYSDLQMTSHAHKVLAPSWNRQQISPLFCYSSYFG